MDTPKHTWTHGATHTCKGNTVPKSVRNSAQVYTWDETSLFLSWSSFVIGSWQQCGERIVFLSTLILGCRCWTVYSVSADLEYIVKSILIRLELDATLAIFWLQCTPESQNKIYWKFLQLGNFTHLAQRSKTGAKAAASQERLLLQEEHIAVLQVRLGKKCLC